MRNGELLIAIRNGDRDAWNELVRQHSQRLWSIARSQNLDHTSATDVVQTVWLTLLDHIDDIRNPDSLGGWMTQVAKREAWRLARLSRRQIPTADLADVAPQAADLGSLQPEAAGILAVSMGEIAGAISQLNADEVRLLQLRFGPARLSQQELAAELGRPVGSIGPTLSRCIEKVRRILNSEASAAAATQNEAVQ